MIAVALALAGALALAFGALLARRAADVASLRARAASAAALSLALGLGAAAVTAISGPIEVGPFAIDGISAPFVPFTACLVLASALCAPAARLAPGWMARACLTGALLQGFFVARAPMLLFALWAGSTVPTYFDLRTSTDGPCASRAFAAHRLGSGLLVGAGLVLAEVGGPLEAWAAPLLVFGIFAREGVFPLHSWVPVMFEGAPMATAALFVHSQAGAYLLLRLVVGDANAVPTALLDVLGITTALYGAFLAIGQPNVRRTLGYVALSQSALVLTGLASGGLVGLTGGVLMIVALGVAHTGLAMAAWCLEARRGALLLDRYAGGHESTPGLAGAFLLLGLAGVGLPGTLGFVASDLVFHAALEHRPWVGVAMVFATAMNGISILRLYFVLFGGARRRTGEIDLTRRERLVLVGLAAILVALGAFPRPLLAPAERTLVALRPELASEEAHAVTGARGR